MFCRRQHSFLSRYRTPYHGPTQNRTGKAILREIHCREYHKVDEKRQGRQGSHLLGQYLLFVSIRLLFHVRKLNGNVASDVDDHSDLLVNVYQKHRFGKDKLVIDSSVGQISRKLQDGGTKSRIRHVPLIRFPQSARTHHAQR